jgi:hypothetical protein
MPAHGYNRKDLHANTSSGGIAVSSGRLAQDKSAFLPLASSVVTGIEYPSLTDTLPEVESRSFRYHHQANSMSSGHQPQATNRLYSLPNNGGSCIDDATDPPVNTISLDDVWSVIRQKKERQMAKEKPKVQSLEEVTQELLASGAPTQDDGPSVRIPVMESNMSPTKSLKKHKSMYVRLPAYFWVACLVVLISCHECSSTFRESGDGKSIVATLEMPPEIEKQDVHISFQRGRLVVTWMMVEMVEYAEENGIIYRERCERSHHRTIPLPEGTRVRVGVRFAFQPSNGSRSLRKSRRL